MRGTLVLTAMILTILASPAASADQAASRPAWMKDLACTVVSQDAAANVMTVKLTGLPAKKATFVAAALYKPEDAVWVQAGQDVKADGEVALEAYDLHGKAVVYAARDAAGKQFLVRAQKGSAAHKPTTVKAVAGASVVAICSIDAP